MRIKKEDLTYLFDAIWYDFQYGSNQDFREKLHGLAKRYNYLPIKALLQAQEDIG